MNSLFGARNAAVLLLIVSLLLGSRSCQVVAQVSSPVFSKKTLTYKTVGQLKIQADVYRHQDDVDRPVIAWFHGGALVMGSRSGVPKQLIDLARQHGFVLVSFDYRLAPETKLPEIIEDLRHGLEWIRSSGPNQFHADPSRLVVAGASAGGYLALMSGFGSDALPTAIVSYWGFGDVDGDWTSKPNEWYRKGQLIDREKAQAGVGQEVLTSSNQENGAGRSTFFIYLKQTGRWPIEVSGFEPAKDREQLTPFCPIRNVSPKFPPTLFLHGTADKDVPVQQSVDLANELKRCGVKHELITIVGGGHSLWGGDPKLIEKAFQRSTEYIREQLTKPSH